MIQYNLRLDDKVKEKARQVAEKKGLSENSLYQTAIEEFLAKVEASDFYTKLMNRIVTSKDKQQILKKLKANKADVLYPEDSIRHG
ncbi:MAG: hypothetical protein IPJ69_14785 [Deltaproteobacteria bacterium]|nr:MAG: hypothetical protein IPJ69_14785 [Deltaproteobacteria bacterium]